MSETFSPSDNYNNNEHFAVVRLSSFQLILEKTLNLKAWRE